MGFNEARNVRMSDSINGGRIFGDRIEEAKRVCVVRDVSGLKPWERAKWMAEKVKSKLSVKTKKASSRSEAAKRAWVTIRAKRAAKAEKVRKK